MPNKASTTASWDTVPPEVRDRFLPIEPAGECKSEKETKNLAVKAARDEDGFIDNTLKVLADQPASGANPIQQAGEEGQARLTGEGNLQVRPLPSAWKSFSPCQFPPKPHRQVFHSSTTNQPTAPSPGRIRSPLSLSGALPLRPITAPAAAHLSTPMPLAAPLKHKWSPLFALSVPSDPTECSVHPGLGTRMALSPDEGFVAGWERCSLHVTLI